MLKELKNTDLHFKAPDSNAPFTLWANTSSLEEFSLFWTFSLKFWSSFLDEFLVCELGHQISSKSELLLFPFSFLLCWPDSGFRQKQKEQRTPQSCQQSCQLRCQQPQKMDSNAELETTQVSFFFHHKSWKKFLMNLILQSQIEDMWSIRGTVIAKKQRKNAWFSYIEIRK